MARYLWYLSTMALIDETVPGIYMLLWLINQLRTRAPGHRPAVVFYGSVMEEKKVRLMLDADSCLLHTVVVIALVVNS